jgi:hypothetical protein
MGRIGLAANTELSQVLRLVSLADRFQMEEVGSCLEEAAIRRLRVGACADVLAVTAGAEPSPICSGGLPRLRAAAHALAAQRFAEVALTDGFIHLDEEVLDALLQDQAMKADRADVMTALVHWMRAAISHEEGGGFPGRKLLARMHHRTFRSLHQPAITECLLALQDGGGAEQQDGEGGDDDQPAARARTWAARLRSMGVRPTSGVGRFVTQLFRF